MLVKSIEVDGFLGRNETIKIEFNSDLNIITGRNGAGKTNILKLIWYTMSGNILLALKEVSFQRFKMDTDKYSITVYRLNKNTCKIDMIVGEKELTFTDDVDFEGDATPPYAEDKAKAQLVKIGNSVFLPTFRRIEGGFSMEVGRKESGLFSFNDSTKNDVEDSLVALSKKLTNMSHIFVSSISTVDIVGLLLRQYADASEQSSKLQSAMSKDVIDSIKQYKIKQTGADVLDDATSLIDSIYENIRNMESARKDIMSPIDAVKLVVESIFKYSGIEIGNRFRFGDAANSVNSDLLSAGEKQMLSFICYNAFYKNGTIFIDEPELSLHVDWQRQLFGKLMGQKSSNQFIIATHSPFIYSKYPDKEVMLNSNRGDGDSEHGN